MPLCSLLVILICLGGAPIAAAQALQPYRCLTDFYDTDRWLQDAKRNFDDRGILLQNGRYHALSIAFLGIMRYEDYLRTGDTTYKAQMLAQYRFFCDSAAVSYTDGGLGMGLRYQESYKDLKAPWYSGMTQGVGLSFLARYYAITHDREALRKMQMLAHFMLQPIDRGGTIGCTPEGLPWIEEYPGSKISPQVLNGFINGLIGLHEYLVFCPDDRLARAVHDSCYAALSQSIGYYDTNHWTDYKRLRDNDVTNGYMRYQLAQMHHLHTLYNDAQWQRQMMIWAQMAYLRPDTVSHTYLNRVYYFGVPVEEGAFALRYVSDTAFARVMQPLKGNGTLAGPGANDFPLQPALLRKNKPLELAFEQGIHQLNLAFNRPDLQACTVILGYNQQGIETPVSVAWYRFVATVRSIAPLGKLVIASKAKPPLGAGLTDVRVPVLDGFIIPKVGYYHQRNQVVMQAGKPYKIDFLAENVVGAKLFYRHDGPKTPLSIAVWSKDHYMDLPADTFIPETNGKYEFMVAFPIRQSEPMISRVVVGGEAVKK